MATKLGYKNPKWITAIEVTNTYPGGYWEEKGCPWFAGSPRAAADFEAAIAACSSAESPIGGSSSVRVSRNAARAMLSCSSGGRARGGERIIQQLRHSRNVAQHGWKTYRNVSPCAQTCAPKRRQRPDCTGNAWISPEPRDQPRQALVPDAVASSARHANSMIAATKQSIFEMTFSASGSGCAGKANPNTAQTANTTNIPDTA
jgi:hypothetical protein